jgi:hypothetical protein
LDVGKITERWDQSEGPGISRGGRKTAQVEIPESSNHLSSSFVLGALHGKWVKTLIQGLVGGLVWGCKCIENKQKIQSHSNMVPRSSVGLGLPIFDILNMVTWLGWVFLCGKMLIMGLSAEAAAKKQNKKEEKENKSKQKKRRNWSRNRRKKGNGKGNSLLYFYLLACPYSLLSTGIAARAEGPEGQQSVTEAQVLRVPGDCGFPFPHSVLS